MNLDKNIKIFRGLMSKTRYKLYLLVAEKGPIKLEPLYNRSHVSKSVIRKHLSILENSGLIHKSCIHKEIVYSLNESTSHNVVIR